MPALFVPEERWARRSWGENHPLTVRAQIFHGHGGGRLRLLGLLAGQQARGRLRRLGRGRGGHGPERHAIQRGRDARRPRLPRLPGSARAKPDPPQSAYTNGVVTPHAAFLALRYAPRATLANLRRLAADFPGLYGKWGFRDSVNVQTKRVSDAYLSLDQGMIMAALGNALGDDVLRRAFADPRLERSLRPVIGIERFNVSP